VLVALHGFGDHRHAFDAAGPLFAAGRLILYAFDQRGFGETGMRGAWPGVDNLIGDVRDVSSAIRRAHPGLPVGMLGESMGGAVALAAAAGMDVDALVLAAPAVRADLTERQVHDLALRLAALSLPWLAVEVEQGGRPWLLSAEAKRFAEDPLIIRELSAGTYDGLIELANRASAIARVQAPALVLQGGLDTTLPPQVLDLLLARLGPSATLKTYPERHHLLLHERGIEEVVDDVIRWLRPILAAATPPTSVVPPEGGPDGAGKVEKEARSEAEKPVASAAE
jgi:acylglycerol lipase